LTSWSPRCYSRRWPSMSSRAEARRAKRDLSGSHHPASRARTGEALVLLAAVTVDSLARRGSTVR
jgi:hypothetical protein